MAKIDATEALMQNEKMASGLTISPNPASSYINLNSKNSMKQIQLLGSTGQVLQTIAPNSNSYRLTIASLSAGQYFLRIVTADGIINQKFIKQ